MIRARRRLGCKTAGWVINCDFEIAETGKARAAGGPNWAGTTPSPCAARWNCLAYSSFGDVHSGNAYIDRSLLVT